MNSIEILTNLRQMFAGDDQMCKEAIELYLSSLPTVLGDVKKSVENKDLSSYQKATHALKGSVSVFGDSTFHEFLKKINKEAKENKPEAMDGYSQLVLMSDSFVSELKNTLQHIHSRAS